MECTLHDIKFDVYTICEQFCMPSGSFLYEVYIYIGVVYIRHMCDMHLVLDDTVCMVRFVYAHNVTRKGHLPRECSIAAPPNEAPRSEKAGDYTREARVTVSRTNMLMFCRRHLPQNVSVPVSE